MEGTITIQNEMSKFAALTYSDVNSLSSEVNAIVDRINGLDLNEVNIGSNTKELDTFLLKFCELIHPDLGQVAIKTCLLVTHLLNKTKCDISDVVLSRLTLHLLALIEKFDEWAHPDLLKTLGAVLYGKGGRLSIPVINRIISSENGDIYKLIFSPQADVLVKKAALQCIENVCMRCSPYIEDEFAAHCLSIFLTILKTPFQRVDVGLLCKMLSVALHGINQILSNTKTAHLSVVGELLAALKAYIFFGRDESMVDIPACLQPIHMAGGEYDDVAHKTSSASSNKKQVKKKGKTKRRPARKQEATSDDEDQALMSEASSQADNPFPWSGLGESDTDLSDTEAIGSKGRLQSYQSKVRQSALATLYSLIKATPRRVIFGYWLSFLPSSKESVKGTLSDVICEDPSSKARLAALVVTSAFLDQSKTALLVATESEAKETLTFTPFSAQLCGMIKDIHRVILDLLFKQSSYMFTTQLLKCLSTIILNTPYQKLKEGLLTRTVKYIRPYLSHKDVNIRVAALTCMGSVVAVHAPLPEVCLILRPGSSSHQRQLNKSMGAESMSEAAQSVSSVGTTDDSDTTEPATEPVSIPNANKPGSTCWLISTCARCITSSRVGSGVAQLPIRVEALQVIRSLATGYLNLIRSSIPQLTHLICQSLQDSNPTVQLHAAKTADSLSAAINKIFKTSTDASAPPASADDVPAASASSEGVDESWVRDAVLFWESVLASPLVEALQNESHDQLRAASTDCLANIGATVFPCIKTQKQIMCLTMLLGLTSDPSPLVKEAACRSLGVLVVYPSQRSDVSFIADVANVLISCMDDEHTNVRCKASWALATLTDALVLNLVEAGVHEFISSFSDILLIKLYDVSAKACRDTDKVKYNGIRALGNLLRYTQAHTLEKRSMTSTIEKSVNLLTASLNQGVMKVRWNACYALGNLLQSDCIITETSLWLEQVYNGLCLALKTSKNYKVRINAASALQAAKQRYKYGSAELFTSVWKSVIVSMTEYQTTDDFNNYKYISTLNQQLSTTMLHLIALIQAPDLHCLGAVLFSRDDIIKSVLRSSNQPLDTSAASANIEKLEAYKLPVDCQMVIKTIKSIVAYDAEEQRQQPQTSFRPSYD